ncbi:hypothetical protein JCM16358_13340 [Halanaerocella petrolearia]
MKNKCLLLMLGLMLLTIQPVNAKTGQLTSQHLRYKKEENVFIATQDVELNYNGTQVTSQHLKMDKEENIAYFSNNVQLTKEQDQVWSQKLELDLQENILIAKEEVKLDSIKQNKPLLLTSNYLKMWTESSDLLAKGDVYVDYDGQEVRGERLKYNAKTEEMIVKQEVKIKEDGNWINARKVVLSLADDTLDATGNVGMEFEISQ